jgi:branched-subunit amino acid aminotransferase/4-amino-4-deoxychorismate lyase
MSVVYLNGQFMPAEDAKISPMDSNASQIS